MCHEVLFLLQLQEGVAELAGEVTCSRNDARGYGHHGFCILCGALSSEVSSVLEQEGKHLTVDSSDKPQLQVLEAVEHCRGILWSWGKLRSVFVQSNGPHHNDTLTMINTHSHRSLQSWLEVEVRRGYTYRIDCGIRTVHFMICSFSSVSSNQSSSSPVQDFTEYYYTSYSEGTLFTLFCSLFQDVFNQCLNAVFVCDCDILMLSLKV